MKNILIVFLLLFFFSCKKYKDTQNDIKGDGYIRGRLFLFDTLTRNAPGTPQASKIVTISYQSPTDTLNYLFSTTTDKDGYFVFKNLSYSQDYRVNYEEKLDSNIFHTAKRENLRPSFDTLHLNAYLNFGKTNGLLYSIYDDAGNPIKGASICIFGNALFFKEGICNNSSYHLTSDSYGHAFIFNIPQSIYYTTAFILVNGITYIKNDTVQVYDKVVPHSIQLNRATQTGINYLLVDSLGAPLPLVSLCFFTSSVAYENGSCSGSNFQSTSDSNGIALKTGVAPGKYYVIGSLKIDSLTLTGKDTIEIMQNQILKDTLHLK